MAWDLLIRLGRPAAGERRGGWKVPVNPDVREEAVMKLRVAVIGTVVMGLALTPAAIAQQCPPEVAEAQSKITSVEAAMKTSALPKEVQAPRTAAGARAQDLQAPRGQEQQAPRGQEQQAPRGQDLQAPRGQEQQAPRGQDLQAPRGQEQQAPRGQDLQAPRGQEQQAPRGQDLQAPRGQDVQAPRTPAGERGPDAKSLEPQLAQARRLVAEAEQECKKGNMGGSREKAQAALDLLK
jgi:hypothetical protein